jgi:hypothetical protein
MRRETLRNAALAVTAVAALGAVAMVSHDRAASNQPAGVESADGMPTPSVSPTVTAPAVDPARLAARPTWQKPTNPYTLQKERYDLTAIKSHPGDTPVKVFDLLGAGAPQMDVADPGIDCAAAWAKDQQTAAYLGSDAEFMCWQQEVYGKHLWRKEQGLSLANDAASSVIGGPAGFKNRLLVTSWYSNDKDDVYLTPKQPGKSIDGLVFLDRKTMAYRYVELVKPSVNDDVFDIQSEGGHVGGLAISGDTVYVADTFGMYVFKLSDLTMRDGKYFLPASERWSSPEAARDKVHIFASLAIDSTAKGGKALESTTYVTTPGATSSILRYSLAKDGTVAGRTAMVRGVSVTTLTPNAVTTLPLINLQGVVTNKDVTYVSSSRETVNGVPDVNGLFYWKQGGAIHEKQMPSNGIEQPAIDPATNMLYGMTENEPTPYEVPGSTVSPRPRLAPTPSAIPSPTVSPAPEASPSLSGTAPPSDGPTPTASPTPTYRPRTNFLYATKLDNLPDPS